MLKCIVLGSTGSVGVNTLELLARFKDKFQVVGLAAGRNSKLLLEQARKFNTKACSLVSSDAADPNIKDLKSNYGLIRGEDSALKLVESLDYDLVVSSIVGIAGLEPTVSAVKNGKIVLLANKESLVCGGRMLIDLAAKSGAKLISIDSEHASLAQLLKNEPKKEILKIGLTASGGPFLNTKIEDLKGITPEVAAKHPRWSMGTKISIDSATMANKALELAEASYLFGYDEKHIDIVVHPQSIVHGFVTFVDGSSSLHISPTDMKGPIAFGLGLSEERFQNVVPALSLVEVAKLTFQELDSEKFPLVNIMRQCLRNGGVAPSIFNSLNEIAVEKFCNRQISFTDINTLVSNGLDDYSGSSVNSFNDILELHFEIVKRYSSS